MSQTRNFRQPKPMFRGKKTVKSYRISGCFPVLPLPTASLRLNPSFLSFFLRPRQSAPCPTSLQLPEYHHSLSLSPIWQTSSASLPLLRQKQWVSSYTCIIISYSPTDSPPKNQAGYPSLHALRAITITAHTSSPKLGFSRRSGLDRKALSFRYMNLSFMLGYAAACPTAGVMFAR